MKSLDLFKLEGRVAIVTGAPKNLGGQHAIALAEAGTGVAIAALTISVEARLKTSFEPSIAVTIFAKLTSPKVTKLSPSSKKPQVAFLGHCLWVGLKKQAERSAPSLTPWQILDQLGRIALVEVWFELRDGRRMCLPRITQPEPAQAVLLSQLNWSLPQPPPPRVYAQDLPPTRPEIAVPPEAG